MTRSISSESILEPAWQEYIGNFGMTYRTTISNPQTKPSDYHQKSTGKLVLSLILQPGALFGWPEPCISFRKVRALAQANAEPERMR